MKISANSIYAYSSYGPTFGSGFDLCKNFNLFINIYLDVCGGMTTNSNYSNFGTAYDLPKNSKYTGNKQHYLTGSYNFTVKEIEVFGLKK